MHLGRVQPGGEPAEARHRREGDGEPPVGELVGDASAVELDGPPGRQVGEGLGEEHQPLARQPQPAQQRLVEHEHGGGVGVRGEGGVVVAEGLRGEPDGIDRWLALG